MPDSFGGGVIDALRRAQRIEPVPSAERVNIDLGEPEPVAVYAAPAAKKNRRNPQPA